MFTSSGDACFAGSPPAPYSGVFGGKFMTSFAMCKIAVVRASAVWLECILHLCANHHMPRINARSIAANSVVYAHEMGNNPAQHLISDTMGIKPAVAPGAGRSSDANGAIPINFSTRPKPTAIWIRNLYFIPKSRKERARISMSHFGII